MKTLLKITNTSNWKQYYRFDNKQSRLFRISKIEAEQIIASWNFEEFTLY